MSFFCMIQLPAIIQKVDDWTAKCTQPDEFGFTFPPEVYASKISAPLAKIREFADYRIEKLKRHIKEKKVSSNSDDRWKVRSERLLYMLRL